MKASSCDTEKQKQHNSVHRAAFREFLARPRKIFTEHGVPFDFARLRLTSLRMTVNLMTVDQDDSGKRESKAKVL